MEIYTMIKEAKNFVRDLAAAITPASLASNDVTPINVNGSYDWNAQAYSYDVCNFGTNEFTTIGTQTGNVYGGDDTNRDSYTD